MMPPVEPRIISVEMFCIWAGMGVKLTLTFTSREIGSALLMVTPVK